MFEKIDSIIMINKKRLLNPFFYKYIKNFSEEFEGILIVKKKENIFLSHPFNYKQAKKQFKKTKVIKYETQKEFEKIIKNNCGNKIAYHPEYISVASFKRIKNILKGKKFVDISKEIEKEREIKNKEEIKKISRAVKETKKVIELVKSKKKNILKKENILKKGISEKKVAEFIENKFRKDGFENAFCIVAFGNNTKNLHHVPTNKKLKEGEEILLDIGCKYEGYCSDISESFWFGKKQTKKKRNYEKELRFVKNKLKIIENNLKAGKKAKELWELCKDMNLPHSLGHGLGLEEHDFPLGIGRESEWKLKEGMVLAIEPGTYNKFGIRVERDYLITKSGFKEL
jgi:Xaa-Pro aminopeptidase